MSFSFEKRHTQVLSVFCSFHNLSVVLCIDLASVGVPTIVICAVEF